MNPDLFNLVFGGEILPREWADRNFLVTGQRGSGKTLTMRLLAQSAISGFYPGSRRRAVYYDAKGDGPSLASAWLKGLKYKRKPYTSRVLILNPFDARGYAYDLAAEFSALGRWKAPRPMSAVADGLAKALLPTTSLGNDNRFWVASAQGVFSGLTQSLARFSPNDWTLRDLVSAACDPRLTKAVIGRHELDQRNLARFQESEKTLANVLQTVASFAWDMEPAATAWDHHLKEGRRFTCADWFEGEDVLVLCGSYNPSTAVEPVNGLFMNFIQEHLANQPEQYGFGSGPETWFFLDELTQLHTLPELTKLFALSRSKGGVQVIGFQNLPGMYEKYGQHKTDAIISLCENIASLKLGCWKTAEFLEKRTGRYVELATLGSRSTSASVSNGQNGETRSNSSSASLQNQLRERPGVYAQELMNLSSVERRTLALDGWYLMDGFFERWQYSTRDLGLLDPDRETKDFVPLPAKLITPRKWTDEDFARLKVKKPKDYNTSEAVPPTPLERLATLAVRWPQSVIPETTQETPGQ